MREPRSLEDIFDSFVGIVDASIGEQKISKLPINASISDKGVSIEVFVPGVENEKDIDVSIEKTSLKICVERKSSLEKPQIVEIRPGKMCRTIDIPFAFKYSDVKASLSNGILKIDIVKPVEEKVKIDILKR